MAATATVTDGDFCFTDLKKSYVDILGNSGKTVQQPKELAPQMDMQFFNPVQQQPQVMKKI